MCGTAPSGKMVPRSSSIALFDPDPIEPGATIEGNAQSLAALLEHQRWTSGDVDSQDDVGNSAAQLVNTDLGSLRNPTRFPEIVRRGCGSDFTHWARQDTFRWDLGAIPSVY